MAEKRLFADVMREGVATAHYRKVKKRMQKMLNDFSTVRYTFIDNPSEQTIEMFENEGFTVERQAVKEYAHYKISW